MERLAGSRLHGPEDGFGGDYPGSHCNSISPGKKRQFGDLEEEEDDVFGSKKAKPKVEDSEPGAATGVILSLRESLQNCKDNLATCQSELIDATSEIQKWHSAFQNWPVAQESTFPEPGIALTYLQNLKSSEDSLKEQLEKVKKREAAFLVTLAKREQEIADLKSAIRDLKTQLRPLSVQTRRLLLDPAIHEEFTRLKNLVEEKEKNLKEMQDNIAAINFTPTSKMGKMLMAKCKTLQEENEEIGSLTSEGKINDLGVQITVLKSQNADLRNQFDSLYRHMEGLTNDTERSNEMVYILQEKLQAKDYDLRMLKELLSKRVGNEEGNVIADDTEVVYEAQPAEIET